MAYEVRPENVDRVREIAERFDLGCSVIGEVTEGNYTCTFAGEDGERETVVDVDAEFLGEGAPMNDLPAEEPPALSRDRPDPAPALDEAFETIVSSPNTASKRWVYRQYDHEVGVRTARRPGDDAGVLSIREAGLGLAISSGGAPNWTDAAPFDGARAVALENATNLAVKGATPLAAVDCLNGGNPEKPDVYGGFTGIVDGLAETCSTLDVPVVGGNVSLYNDSPAGPIPPTPTLAMVGTRDDPDAPPMAVAPEGTLLLVGDLGYDGEFGLGGSEYLLRFDGEDRFPALPEDPKALVETLATVVDEPHVRATHDVSHGGLAVSLAEMVSEDAGIDATLSVEDVEGALFHEQPGRALIQTTDPDAVREAFDGIAPVHEIGIGTDEGLLSLSFDDDTLELGGEEIADLRSTIDRGMD